MLVYFSNTNGQTILDEVKYHIAILMNSLRMFNFQVFLKMTFFEENVDKSVKILEILSKKDYMYLFEAGRIH